ncbi:MAG: hypothetical protein E6K74_09820 [Candidatus Eisenbacteria bacterium]|uniref:DUF5723 domain-containing protein n=1 Tax=Eiseniibacteriota bacterium TaxID=2212470 RepID=A0A538SPK9_UNCEI|nr:MAG: hypothetical protein E6K74_09820 [Candidatus Eisenbacteria bacterium]
MSQRKLMAVLSLAAVVALTAGESRASLSRVEGMSLSVPTLSQFTDDYVNIYYYPASVVRQNNLVLAELGNNPSGLSEFTVTAPSIVTTTDQSFTVIRNFPRFGAIAFQMKQSALNNLTASSSLNNEQLDAIWGKAFSSFDFAVRVDITNSSAETSTTPGAVVVKSRGIDNLAGFDPYPFGVVTANQIVGGGIELNTFGVTPAITLHMSNDNRFEGAVTYRKYSLDRSSTAAGNERWQDDGSASYVVNARAFVNQGDRHVWVPAAWYVNDDLGWTVDNFGGAAGVTRSAKETYRQYGVGISDNMRVNDNNLLLWGVSVAQAKHHFTRSDAAIVAGETQELTEKTTAVPVVFAAIETDATKWLKVRVGANRTLVGDRTETVAFGPPNVTTIDKTRSSAFNLSLGTGMRWNNLDVDMTLNEKFPLTGGYILSGDRSTPFTRASATYHF